MSAPVLSIGIPPQERERLCATAAAELCRRAAFHLRAASYVDWHDEPYLRAVYVHRAGGVAAQRVGVASGAECGSYVRLALRAAAADTGSAPPGLACWLTVVLEDTCILHHAVFALEAGGAKSVRLVYPLPASGGAHEPGALRWSLQLANDVDADVESDDTANGEAPPAAAEEEGEGGSGDDTASCPPASGAVTSPRAPLPPDDEPPVQSAAASVGRAVAAPPSLASSSVSHHIRRSSPLSAPCPHAARNVAKAIAAVHASALPPAAAAAVEARARPELPPPPHLTLAPAAARQPAAPPRTAAAHPMTVYDRIERYTSDAAPARRSASSRRSLSDSTPPAAQPLGSAHPPSLATAPPPPVRPNELVVYDSPAAELTWPRAGPQWGDAALRTRYAPRREELWEIADAMMTHNYAQTMLIEDGATVAVERGRA